jgi:hypothetical protein
VIALINLMVFVVFFVHCCSDVFEVMCTAFFLLTVLILIVNQTIVFSFNSKLNLLFKISDSCMSFMMCTSSSYAFEQCYAGVWCNRVMVLIGVLLYNGIEFQCSSLHL